LNIAVDFIKTEWQHIKVVKKHSPLCMVTWQMTQTLASLSRYFSLHLRLQQPAQYTCKADNIIYSKHWVNAVLHQA